MSSYAFEKLGSSSLHVREKALISSSERAICPYSAKEKTDFANYRQVTERICHDNWYRSILR